MRVFVAFVAVCATAAALSDVSVFSATLNRVVKAEATDNFYDVAEELCGGKSKCSAAVADELFSRAATMPRPNVTPLDGRTKQVIASMINASVDPCVDFYEYATGKWRSSYTLPPDTAMWDFSFSQIANTTTQEEFNLLNENFPFITPFFETCKDQDAINAAGWQPALSPVASRVAAASDFASLMEVVGELQQAGAASNLPFQTQLMPEMHYARENVLYMFPTGPVTFNMSDTTAFIKGAAALFDAVKGYLPSSMTSTQAATMIVGLAANISSVPEPPAPSSDSTGYIINNTMFLTLEEFQDATQFPLSRFFASAPIVTRVASVFTPYIGHILDEYMMAPLDAVKATVLFQYLMDTVAFLPESVQSAALPVVEAGAVAPGLYQDRSNLCLQTVISTFNNMLTHEFVLEDFPKGNKAAATDLVNRIWTALGGDLETVPWADAATKAMLHTKWTDIKKNIGYYSTWNDDPHLDFPQGSGNFVAMASVAQAYDRNRTLHQLLYQVPDRSRFPPGTDILTQNAFYDPTHNNINLLAGLMAFPFFSSELPQQLNIASYGMVIGHEMGHGFDNSGTLYNGTGAYIPVISAASHEAFVNRTQCLVEQYSSYVVPLTGGMHINGQQTLGENIADSVGTLTSWQAYKTLVNGTDNTPLYDGLTNDQLHFVWYAIQWAEVVTPAFAVSQLENDVHSPGRFRVIGPLSNFKPFAEAFNCPASSPMGRSLTSAACTLW